jgi:hypothetical protein
MSVEILSAALPETVILTVSSDAGNDANASYWDVNILDDNNSTTDPDSILEGNIFDGYCVDADRFINSNTFTAQVYSTYGNDLTTLSNLRDESGAILFENPGNFDLVNWIINQHFEGNVSTGNGIFTSGDVQRAVWSLIDNNQLTNGLGDWSQARVDEILSLAQNGEGFIPTYEYTTIFEVQVIGQMGTVLVPTGAGGATKQSIIIGVELPDPDPGGTNPSGGDPSIDVEKYVSIDGGMTWVDADDVTGPSALEGTNPQFKFVVQNTGNVDLTGVTLSDSVFNIDNGDNTIEIGNLSADDGVAGGTDQYEYIFTAATWQSGQHTNTATTSGTYTDDNGATSNVDDSDDANYFGADPSITIDKVTNNQSGAAIGDGLLIQVGSDIQWIYTVTNDGNVALSNIVVDDDQLDNDPIFNREISGNGNEVFDAGEVWEYIATGTAQGGSYSNTGKVTGNYTDDLGNTASPMDTDDSSYFGVVSPGARTPGFWAQHLKLWDGDVSNDTDNKGGGAGKDGFPISDLLLSPYSFFNDTDGDSNGDGKLENAIDPVTGQQSFGILVGDYNRNGVTDNGENTIFYELDEAQTIVDASQKVQKDDKRYTLDRSLIASWLNWTAGNDAPTDDINDGIAWIQATTPDENSDGLGDGNLILGASTYAVPASDSFWQDPTIIPSGENINNALDYYNNTGVIA